ncbi:MAG: DUF3891 family protein [Planctomycetota bacterium]|nr:DUF3891 family protein [Planctomycetota bacterium]
MIRRDVISDQGVHSWLLISQVQHARLAGDLARQWPFWSDSLHASLRAELLSAIYHHDDGWTEWERQPKLRPADGAPLNFLEMPLQDSLDIWGQSIRQSVRLGPLAAYVVAGHFLYLLDQSTAADQPAACLWSASFRQQQDSWSTQWQSQDVARHQPAAAREALSWLQLLDALSLWFCCDGTPITQEITLPDGNTVRFTRRAEQQVTVSPWLFDVPNLQLSVETIPCHSIPCDSGWTLLCPPGTTGELQWRVTAD